MSRPSPSLLRLMQNELEALYGIDIQLDVDAYCIDDHVRACIPGAIDGLVEQLFVREHSGSFEMALYIAPSVLQKLEACQRRRRLHWGNFEAFCIALEGVSHFVFLAWRAQLERPVTALEMELQAEVDKFVICWLWVLGGRAHRAMSVDALLAQLFKGWALRQQVPEDEHERYAVASRAAHNACRRFVREAGRTPQVAVIARAARHFFRCGLPEKLQAA